MSRPLGSRDLAMFTTNFRHSALSGHGAQRGHQREPDVICAGTICAGSQRNRP